MGIETGGGWLARLVWVVALALALTLPLATWAQQESSSQSQQTQSGPGSGAMDSQTTDESSSSRAASTLFPVWAQVRQLGRATALLGSPSPLRWGSIYVGGFDLVGVYDSAQSAAPGGNRISRFGLFRTSLVFDRRLKRSRIALQFSPRMAIIEGKVRSNAASNHDLSLDWYYELNARWNLTLRNNFNYARSRQLFPDDFLQTDMSGGGILQTNFLDAAGSYLRDGASATLGFHWTPRTQLSITNIYGYSYQLASETNYLNRLQQFGTVVVLNHALSPRKGVGAVYKILVMRVPVSGMGANAYFHSAGFYYSEQLSRTWWIRGGVELSVASGAASFPGRTALGSFSVLKTFDRSTLAFAYTRSQGSTEYLTDRISDRGDASYGVRLSRRWEARVGVGYYGESGPPPRNSGEYATSTLEYHASPTVTFFGRYFYRSQQSPTGQWLSGAHNVFAAGFRWEPPAIR